MLQKVEICGVNTSTLPVLSNKEQQELMLRLKGGDEEAREKFITCNLRLVLSLVRRFWAKNANADDVFQAGCVAYVNLAGGMRIVEPAIDLGIAMAVVSSFKNRAIEDKVIVFGEIGLSGEVRGVSMAEQRVAEAAKLGFTTCILPEVNRGQVKHIKGIRLIGVRTVRDAVDFI